MQRRADAEGPIASRRARLELEKLQIDIRNAPGKWTQLVVSLTPLLSVIIAVAGLFLTIRQQATEQRDAEQARQEGQRQFNAQLLQQASTRDAAAKQFQSQQLQFQEQLLASQKQSELARSQNERYHQDDLMTKAIQDLSSASAEMRIAAVVRLSAIVSSDPTRVPQIVPVLLARIGAETNSEVIHLSQVVAVETGEAGLPFSTEANRAARRGFEVALGRYAAMTDARQREPLEGNRADTDKSYYTFQPSEHEIQEQIRSTIISLVPQFTEELPFEGRSWSNHEQVWFESENVASSAAAHSEYMHFFLTGVRAQDVSEAQDRIKSESRAVFTTSSIIVEVLRKIGPVRKHALAGLDIRGCLLIEPDLTGLDLSGVEASDSVWIDAVLNRSSFNFANLSNTEFYRSYMISAKFIGADLHDANFGWKGFRWTKDDRKSPLRNIQIACSNWRDSQIPTMVLLQNNATDAYYGISRSAADRCISTSQHRLQN